MIWSALLPIVSGVLDKLIPDPVERDKARAELLKAQQSGEFKELEARMEAIVMEAKSTDPWTSRARPSFLYVMYVLILGAIPMGFLHAFEPTLAANVVEGFGGWLGAIPAELWGMFTLGYLGYASNRSNDKARLLGKEVKPGLISKLFG